VTIPRPVNIMLVEDDDVDVMNVSRAFEKANITDPVVRAGDGVEALELLRNGSTPFERLLILLDLNLPRMNGLELLHELRSDPLLRRIPVVVLTTSNDERDKVQAFEMNVAGYLLKPTTFTDFVELMGALNGYWARAEMP
jgi:CheY-like chemotaxis protein